MVIMAIFEIILTLCYNKANSLCKEYRRAKEYRQSFSDGAKPA